MSGSKAKLYLVSTPIGNLEDISKRALRILNEVDLIAAEDTRRTGKLLAAYNIKKKTISYRDYNKEIQAKNLIKRLENGESIALVSDSGTPCISDPGYYLVKLSIKENIEVVPIPGASSILAGLIVSGLPTDRFVFEGFLPRKKKKREKRFRSLIDEDRTIIIFESPHRLVRTFKEILHYFGDVNIVVCRELTKKFEEVRRDRVSNLLAHYAKETPRGEFVVYFRKNGLHETQV